jgi:hypothetical protein
MGLLCFGRGRKDRKLRFTSPHIVAVCLPRLHSGLTQLSRLLLRPLQLLALKIRVLKWIDTLTYLHTVSVTELVALLPRILKLTGSYRASETQCLGVVPPYLQTDAREVPQIVSRRLPSTLIPIVTVNSLYSSHRHHQLSV